jgi:hypothetical protein
MTRCILPVLLLPGITMTRPFYQPIRASVLICALLFLTACNRDAAEVQATPETPATAAVAALPAGNWRVRWLLW